MKNRMGTEPLRQSRSEANKRDVVRILIFAEDQKRLTQLCLTLDSPSYICIGARSISEAREALDYADLLTIILPVTGVESFDLVREIRRRPGKRDLPILLVCDQNPAALLAQSGYSIHWADVLVVSTPKEEGLRSKIDYFYEQRRQNIRMVEQAAQLESERRFHLLVESLPEPIWISSSAGEIIYFNARLRQVLGEISRTQWHEILHPEDRLRVEDAWLESLNTGQLFESQLRFRDRQGQFRWFLVRAAPIRSDSGEIIQWFGTCTDIHEKAVECSKFEHFLDSLVENLPEMVFVKDAKELRFIRVNRAGEQVMGFREEEMLGKNDYDFFPKDQADFFVGKDRAVLASGKLLDITEEPIDTSKGRKYLHTKKIPLLGEDGKPEYLLGISQNITEEKRNKEALKHAYDGLEKRVQERTQELARANEQLRDKGEMLHAIIDHLSDGILLLDPQWKYIYLNEAGGSLLGISGGAIAPEGRIFEKGIEITDEEGKPVPVELLPGRQVLAGARNPKPVVVKLRFRNPHRECWVMISAAPVLDERGLLTHAVVILKDFTERKRLEDQQRILAQAGPTLASSLDYDLTLKRIAELMVPNVADWVYINLMDRDGIPRTAVTHHWKPAYLKKVEEIRRKYPRDWDAVIADPRVFKTGKSEFYPELNEEILTVGYRSPERARAIMENFDPKSAMVVAIHGASRVLGVMTLVSAESGRSYDEADLKFAEELASRAGLAIENAILYKKTGEAVALRDEFLTIASHELKTPITSLKLQLQMVRRRIKSDTGAPPSREFIEKSFDVAITQVGRLTTLVEDLLDVSRMRAGKLGLNLESVNVSEMLHEIVERYRSHFESTKTPLSVKIQPGILAQWDRSRIEQVIVNLISNALKYAPGKEVSIDLRTQLSRAMITIEDHGPGVRKTEQDRIFERFERAVSARNVSGLGLGLFISKGIIHSHRGEIWIESEPGHGAKFTVAIPLFPAGVQPT